MTATTDKVALLREIVEVIRKDAKVRFRYSCEGGECVIGGLAKHAGFALPSKIETREGLSSNHLPITANQHADLAEALSKRYGLSVNQLEQLQRINDNVLDRRERQEKLIEKVTEFFFSLEQAKQ